MSALGTTLLDLGDDHILTARHFGNLGRLYQTLRQYEMAEKMQLKAISIKERLLGHDDYEVAVSVGHLASLYNFDMGEYDKAEAMYKRSMNIGLALHGPAYSGERSDLSTGFLTYLNVLV